MACMAEEASSEQEVYIQPLPLSKSGAD